MEKGFDHWNHVKKSLDNRKNAPSYQERQIWWCSVGMNVGFEVYGKGKTYTRPVLVVRKFSKHSFWGIPMSSKIKELPGHFQIHFKDKNHSLKLEQMRLFDSKRLLDFMGYLPTDQYYEVTRIMRGFFPEKP